METPEKNDSEMENAEIEGAETESADMESPEPDASKAESLETEGSESEAEELEGVDEEASDPESTGSEVTETKARELDASEPETEKKGLNIFQRILLYAAIVVGSIFMLLGLAGVVGVWVANTPVTETVLAILAPIDNTLQRLETVAGEAGLALSEVSTSLGDADQRVQDLGAGLAETSVVAEALNLIFDVDVEQGVNKAGDSIRSIYDTLVAIEETIEAINNIPLLNIEVPGSTEIAAIRTGMEEMAVSAAELREESQGRREDRAENLVEAISAPLNRLNDRVDEMHGRITGAEERLGLAVEGIDEIQSKVPRWIDIASIIATLLLAWLMFSQGAVIVLCWRTLHEEPGATPA
jgi:hypothetical protein